jgi:sarcosine oxidase subunit delta
MKILTCPINGPRPIQEFVYGGDVTPIPDPDAVTDAEWAKYVFNRDGAAAVTTEWWYHAPSGVWFVADRDTGTDSVLRTYLYES